GEYGFEQLEKAVAAVKAGQGVRVSEQRKKELEEQFPDKDDSGSDEKVAAEEPRSLSAEEKAWCDEIGLWPELARVWMSRI
ncbi:MAG: hypothetical protein II492_05645, partial [Eubacterium sp.]|nr:hypothetical protein [Eubacterium sp.]